MTELPVVPSSPVSPDAPAAQANGQVRGQLETAGMVNHPERSAALEPEIIKELSKVYDPEIPVNIYELGLIYEIIVDASNAVGIRMTLTAPNCPAAQILPGQVKAAAAGVAGVTEAKVDVVWEPPWDKDRMSEAAKLQLGMF